MFYKTSPDLCPKPKKSPGIRSGPHIARLRINLASLCSGSYALELQVTASRNWGHYMPGGSLSLGFTSGLQYILSFSSNLFWFLHAWLMTIRNQGVFIMSKIDMDPSRPTFEHGPSKWACPVTLMKIASTQASHQYFTRSHEFIIMLDQPIVESRAPKKMIHAFQVEEVTTRRIWPLG